MAYVPHIFLTVDVLLLRTFEERLQLLLIKRLKEPYKDYWAFPGGFVDKGEDLLSAAKRELLEETSVNIASLEQFYTYGDSNRDPRGHTASVIYYAFIDYDVTIKAADDAKDVAWFDLTDLPPLAFDHHKIISDFQQKKIHEKREIK